MKKTTLLKAASAARWVGAAALAGLLCGIDWQDGFHWKMPLLVLFSGIAAAELIIILMVEEDFEVWPTDLVLDEIRGETQMYYFVFWLLLLPGDILKVPFNMVARLFSAVVCNVDEKS